MDAPLNSPADLPKPVIIRCDDCGHECMSNEARIFIAGFVECDACKHIRMDSDAEAYMRASGRRW